MHWTDGLGRPSHVIVVQADGVVVESVLGRYYSLGQRCRGGGPEGWPEERCDCCGNLIIASWCIARTVVLELNGIMYIITIVK